MRTSTPLTDALLRPLRAEHLRVTADEAARLSCELTALAARQRAGGPFRLTDFTVRSALAPAGSPMRETGPFAWTALTARRSLGLASVRSLVAGRARAPHDAVRVAVHESIASVREGARPSSSLDPWVAGLSPAARAIVEAEAITWATRMWTALDWSALPAPPVVGRDHWWDSPHSSLLALRSRAEVRTEIRTGGGGQGGMVSALLVVLGGGRRSSIRSELAVVALVEALRSARSVPPGRVIGWWPESGRFVTVDVDHHVLADGLDAVRRTLDWIAASPRHEGGPHRAAA